MILAIHLGGGTKSGGTKRENIAMQALEKVGGSMKQLDEAIQKASQLPSKTIAVAGADDEEVLRAVHEAGERNIAHFILFGNINKMERITKEQQLNLDHCEIRPASNEVDACRNAVRMTSTGNADIIMKGMVSTRTMLKAVLDPEIGVRKGLLSHVAVFEVEGYQRLLFVTDAGMNISPDLKTKSEIITNAVTLAASLGIKNPKLAPLAAVEVVNPDMQATLDGAALSLMANRGQIAGCIIDGPLALDNAIDLAAAQHKGIHSPVAGQADILLVPNIESGNILYKSLVYFARAKVGALVVGGKVPIVLTSRADSHESKLYSIALSVLAVEKRM